MQNYQIITDSFALRNFIEWLPELQPHETFYLCLFARSKYVKDTHGLPHIRSDKAQLKRFTSNKERLYDKIRQLSCPVGSYKQKDITVPQEALALYITINPRDFIMASKRSIHKLIDLNMQPYNGFHPYQEVMSEIQKAKSRSVFVSFDFDCSHEDYVKALWNLRNKINEEAFQTVQTRGGFHAIVETSKVTEQFKNTWYKDIKEQLRNFSSDAENAGDIMLPVPGTYQGGFTPKFFLY